MAFPVGVFIKQCNTKSASGIVGFQASCVWEPGFYADTMSLGQVCSESSCVPFLADMGDVPHIRCCYTPQNATR
ncbi:hypothetical protein GDO78_020802 [Eleutherodactylus coqui]|uniref:Uncharacterized protein n=1 Tax=Eleutherodactylus coqui TaxID=57060 RepID=A0A8J6EA56_ELECQ|nr:hypothetical protein GDO78_020802 [Eleutherodactylus coqui]